MALSDYINNKPVLESKRLILKSLKVTDVADLAEWTADSSLYTYWGKNPGKADRDPSLLFAKSERPTKSFHWGIVLKEINKLIGELWVYRIEGDRMATVAFRVAGKYQKMGIASEALKTAVDFCFCNTELKRLFGEVDVRNTASVKVFENCGFLREGLIRQGKSVSVWCDYYIYAILKEDHIG